MVITDGVIQGKFTGIAGILSHMTVDFISTHSLEANSGLVPKIKFKLCSDVGGNNVIAETDFEEITIKALTATVEKTYCRKLFAFTKKVKITDAQKIYVFHEWQDYTPGVGQIYYVLDWSQQVNVYNFMAKPWPKFKFFVRA